jgi:signal transduction histidine kinase
MTQREFDKGVNVQASTLQRLRKQVERITRLVVDLLDVSRLERGALSLKKQKTDIVELIKECILDYELKDPDREILFQKEVELLFVQVDPIRLFQVVSNLIDNATKYSAKTLPIEIKLEIKANRFKILVKDFGPGISQIEQEALFTPFSRGSTELTEKSGGLGLGLYIGRMIIELHGGFIGLESVVGKGSTFFFEIPIEEFHS